MPARLPRVGFGDRSHSLYEAVKLLTGLDQLSAIADGAASFTHGAKRFLKYARDQGADRQKTKFEESIAKAAVKAQEVAFDISTLKTLGQKDIAEHLREAAQKASDLAGAHLAKLKSEIATSIDTTKADSRAKIKRGVASGRAILGQGTKGIEVFAAWAALKAANEDAQFKKLPDTLTSVRDALSAALAWHSRQVADQKFRLKALASHYYVVPTGGVAGECPLCTAELTSAHQQKLAVELADLKKDAEAAERKLDDVCVALEKKMSETLTADVGKHFDVLAAMEPRVAYATAVQERFSNEPPFSDILIGISKSCKEIVAEQTKKLPEFTFKEFNPGSAGLPAPASALLQKIHRFEGIASLASWWSSNREPFRDAWSELLGKKDGDGKWPTRSIEGRLTTLEDALEKAEPLDDLSKYLVAAAEANEAWEKIQDVQKVREAIAKALEPLKDLRLLVAAETASSISALAGKIKLILDRIHLRERLAYENASLGNKAIHVEGSFEPGMQIDAALVANSSWLKAILWAFVLALREQTIEGLKANPFPLVVLDDPQMTFDPRNKRKWAEELARLANVDSKDPRGMQLFLATHERQFFQCLVNHEKLNGQHALKQALKDPVFIEALWLLVRTPQAAGSTDFVMGLRELGFPAVALSSLSDMLVAYDAALEKVQRRSHAGTTDLGEMARCAGLAAFGEAVRDRLPGLWAPTAEDVRASVSVLKGTEQFAAMAHRFYSNFVERVIHYYIDRNLHHMVGPDRVANRSTISEPSMTRSDGTVTRLP